MKPIARYLFSTLFALFCLSTTVQAQSMKVSGNQVVRAGETLTLNAGQVVEFEPGAVLQVEGNLQINGSASAPVVFKSSNPNRPGFGILVSGISESGKIAVSQAQFEGLIQALRFDPFWYRSSVDLNNISISSFNSGEPVIYVSKPLLDLRDGMDIQFTAKNIEVRNSASGMLFESIGADGIRYEFDNLLFQENYLTGSDASMGVLHLEVARPLIASQVNIGNMAFNRNFADDVAVGISVGGGLDELSISAIYSAIDPKLLIYDRSSNIRLPRVIVRKSQPIEAYSRNSNQLLIKSLEHRPGKISISTFGNAELSGLFSGDGTSIDFSVNKKGDTVEILYVDGFPTLAGFESGLLVQIPPAAVDSNADEAIDSSLESHSLDSSFLIDQSELSANFSLILPVFKKENEQVINSSENLQIGYMFGGAMYDGRDLPWKYFPIPASMEYSHYAFAQKSLNSRFSGRVSLNIFSVSVHNIASPALISGNVVPETFRKDGTSFTPYNFTYPLNFLTRVQSAELTGLWNLKSKARNSTFMPSLIGGIGVMHFTPYKTMAVSPMTVGLEYYGDSTPTFAQYRRVMLREYKMNSRKIGTQGQLFVPGLKPYSPFALSAILGLNLEFSFDKFSFNMEARAAITSTDYLDDFGKGIYFGGDYDKFIQAAIENNPNQDEAFIRRMYPNQPQLGANAYRSSNRMPDGYFQLHMGLAYHLY